MPATLAHTNVRPPKAETSSCDASRDRKRCLLWLQKVTRDSVVKYLLPWRGAGLAVSPGNFMFTCSQRHKSPQRASHTRQGCMPGPVFGWFLHPKLHLRSCGLSFCSPVPLRVPSCSFLPLLHGAAGWGGQLCSKGNLSGRREFYKADNKLVKTHSGDDQACPSGWKKGAVSWEASERPKK